MPRNRPRIQINWKELLVTVSSPSREDDICFESPSSAPPAAARDPRAGAGARASPGGGKRRGTPAPWRRAEAPRGEVGGRSPCVWADGGARRPLTRAAAKAADRGPDARPADKNVFDFDEDEGGEDLSRKYSSKLYPIFTGNKNYGKLPLNEHKSRGPFGQRETRPVDRMYSSQPCSKSGKQRRPYASDSEESDDGKCQQSGHFSFSRITKRRKERLQDLSSVYSRKVQNVVLLDDEDMQTEGEVNCEMSDRRNELKIYYPSRDDPEAVELTSSDINCLDPGAYLSSPVINYYIQKIKRATLHSEDCRNKFYIFNTYFYGKLEEALDWPDDFSKLRRWWKGVNIFHRPYIILPIHGMAHWSLVIICMPAKESISGPSILHLDSLGMHQSTKILKTVGGYLVKEWQELKKVPQQNNAYDCGVFMLYYIERFIREAPERFTIDKLDMFNCSWFKPEDASELRQRIRELLLEEFESARLENAMSGAASDGSDIEDSIKGGELYADAPSDSSEMAVELGNTGKSYEGMEVADSEEECEESGGAEKINEGIKAAELEEAIGDSGDASKSFEGINPAEPEEESGEPGDSGRSIESDEASMELGHAGATRKGIKAAASEEASVESMSADKSMGSVSDDAPTSSSKPKNEAVIPSTPIPDVVCDSCSDSETEVNIVISPLS
ncbi:unnamed protein product [Urochloa humidicola]